MIRIFRNERRVRFAEIGGNLNGKALMFAWLFLDYMNHHQTSIAGPDFHAATGPAVLPLMTHLPRRQTNLSAVPPFIFTDPATNARQKFYKILIGP